MKLATTLVLILGFSFQAFSQNIAKDQKGLYEFIDSYMSNAYSKQYDNIVNQIYPEMYHLITPDKFKSKMLLYFEGNEAYSVDIGKEIPLYSVSDIYVKDSTQYAFATFDYRMTLTYNIDLDDASKQAVLDNAKRLGNEGYFINDSRVNLKRVNSMIVLINGPNTDFQWTLVNFNENDPMNYKVMPKYVIKDMLLYAKSLVTAKSVP